MSSSMGSSSLSLTSWTLASDPKTTPDATEVTVSSSSSAWQRHASAMAALDSAMAALDSTTAIACVILAGTAGTKCMVVAKALLSTVPTSVHISSSSSVTLYQDSTAAKLSVTRMSPTRAIVCYQGCFTRSQPRT